ncbi:MAG: conjugal transfer protein TrbE [Deltaproteobacteria bacterium]|nr:conjugal transfer protein TrbE [Deltaproteobacteria bacterium]
MFNLREYQERPGDKLADLLPWALLVAPGVVEQKDGNLQKTVSFRGPDLASSTRAGLIANTARINNALRRFGSGWSIFVEAKRSFSQKYPDSNWPNKVSKMVDDERRLGFEKEGAHFDSQYFLTLVYSPPTQTQSKISSWFLGKQEQTETTEERLTYFNEEARRLIDLLKQLMPSVIELDDAQTLTYLHSTISSKKHPVTPPEVPVYLDAILPDEEVSHGLETKLGSRFMRAITVRGFPGSTYPGILDSLNELQYEYRWVSRYIAFGKDEAKEELERFRKRWYAKRKGLGAVVMETATQTESALGDTGAVRKSSDADEALQELEDDYVSFGHFTATVIVWGETRKEADNKARAIEAAINGKGFVTYLEHLGSSEAWLGSLPGHLYANVNRPIISSLNLAHMLPLSAVWAGNKENEHLKGPPHMIVKTRGSTPFRLSTNIGDVGHTLIIGPTGAGKSVLLSFMALQWLRYDGAQVYIFDKGGSARASTLAVGGDYFVPGSEGGNLCFQPLSRVDEEGERSWASDWVSELLELNGVAVSPEDKKEIWGALSNLASQEAQHRTLTILHGLLQNERLRNGLLQYTLEGSYGDILDGDKETLHLGDWQTFELETLMEKRGAVPPVLSYLFHRLEAKFTGRPTLLILDEAWLFLDNPQFAAKIREWLKVLRKANVYVVFATQSLSDAMNSSIAPAVLESCLSKIFLPNQAAKDEDVRQFYKRIGLNDKQIDIISQAVPKRDYYYHSSLGNRLFELGLGKKALAFCASSSKEDHLAMDGLEKADFAKEWLHHKGIRGEV